ncbi:excalibur calcium-binding domain-containing protein [Phenylobacterium sp. 58.2.17]|uniref:excalibur calcium-binding domain-containing protein n=1 Tax=Phenylobacterium sp. 58.2.17 TaxID=2969306 RepID=UPI0022645D15|nr:excalibur calcium-binding domain-containing protein [Phenylobacterium sp. 58.2.17]MCX7586227.1 excalibur calcium-binding domain-containing protein [Phenylobacterium sp. 58.2.17]
MPPTAKELRLKQINARFKAVTPRRYRRRWRPSVSAVLVSIMVIGAIGFVLMLPQNHLADPAMVDMSIKDRVRHLLAAPNCSAARLVGATPARRGEPGYWDDHDADHDGIACEPIPAWHR